MFWVRKRKVSLRHFFLRAQDLCLIEKTDKIHFGGLYFHVYIPIIRTTDNPQ